MNKKRLVSMLLVSAMTAALFTGCGSDGNQTSGDSTTSAGTNSTTEEAGIKEFTAFFAVIVRAIRRKRIFTGSVNQRLGRCGDQVRTDAPLPTQSASFAEGRCKLDCVVNWAERGGVGAKAPPAPFALRPHQAGPLSRAAEQVGPRAQLTVERPFLGR